MQPCSDFASEGYLPQNASLPTVYTAKVYMPAGYKPQGNATSKTSTKIEVKECVLRNLGIPPTQFTDAPIESMRDFVYVTGADRSHFVESQDMVASIQKYSPDKEIIFFDLGLTQQQREEVGVRLLHVVRSESSPQRQITRKLSPLTCTVGPELPAIYYMVIMLLPGK